MQPSKSLLMQTIRILLAKVGLSDNGLDTASYVFESAIQVQSNPLALFVEQYHLIPANEFERVNTLIARGVSWIHINLYHTPDGECVISLSQETACNNPHPQINVSVDPLPLHVVLN